METEQSLEPIQKDIPLSHSTHKKRRRKQEEDFDDDDEQLGQETTRLLGAVFSKLSSSLCEREREA